MSRKALSHSIRLTALNRPETFDLSPDADETAQMAERLGIQALRKVTFSGQVQPDGARDVMLSGHLGASVVQLCGVTLVPVTTRIEEDVTRRYLADMPPTPDAEEAEMPEDVEIEAMPQTLDLMMVLEEALSLALPMFPRAPDAGDADVSVTEPGKSPMTDDDAKPFATLAGLRDKLGREDP